MMDCLDLAPETDLLAYFRSRRGPVHPVRREDKAALLGKAASRQDLEAADDALLNRLITSPNFPRHDFGSSIDWHTNRHPGGDLEWIVQLHRHDSWGALGRAYWHTGDEKYARAYFRLLDDWLSAVPNNRDFPGWRRIEVGIRGYAFTCHFQYFIDAPSYPSDLFERFLASLDEHASYLDEGYTVNNWGLMEAEGMAFIGVLFPEFKRSAAWKKKAFAHLGSEISRQVHPDGMHDELCWGYHLGAIGWFGRAYQLARANDLAREFPAGYEGVLEKMTEVAYRCLHPDRHISCFGDDWSRDLSARLGKAASFFPANQSLQYLESQGGKGEAPATALALPDGGLYSMRSGWGPRDLHMVLKCGPDGGWHCQPDNQTFELAALGRVLMQDSGCYIYHGENDARAWFRRSRVHQTLTLDNADTAYAPRQRLWQPGGDLHALVTENLSYPGLTHRRAVFVQGSQFVLLIDEAYGPASGRLDLHFQLPPGKALTDPSDLSARSVSRPGAEIALRTLAQPGLRMVEEEGWVSSEYGRKEPRTAFSFQLDKPAGTGSCRFATLLAPFEKNPPEMTISRLETALGGHEVGFRFAGADYGAGYDLNSGKAWIKKK